MDRLTMLSGEYQFDDHLLETDIMRFVAIIGIVFWIIFAIVKSMPLYTPVKESSLKQPEQTNNFQAKPNAKIIKLQNKPITQSSSSREMSKTDSKKQVPQQVEAVKEPVARMQMTAKLHGIYLQFNSLDDLLGLIDDKKIRIFCRAQARGFDLFFEGFLMENSVDFKGTSNVPPSLWEIKSGKDRLFFLNQLAKTDPDIGSFPEKQVFVAFADAELEARIILTLDQLQKNDKNGILSITRNKDVEFHEFEKKPVDEATGTDGGE